jgi:glycosyltransferase involved in cell wall biosynthesis
MEIFHNMKRLPLSVIICTYNRADLLNMSLESLTKQTLSKDKFEVVLIDDGSSDHTKDVSIAFHSVLPLNYFYQNNAGLASARNHGIFAACGRILFFFDDDDIAAPTLLEEHLKTHERYREDYYGVLNFTKWAPHLEITPLMEFVTNIGCFLFSYPVIRDGDILDYTYFWGGRSSCKRSFLIEHGVFNPVFRFGCEDIELGYRLSKHGLRIIYNKNAVSMMSRPVLFDEFCHRLFRQGKSQYIFSTLHNDPDVHNWAEVMGADEKWESIRTVYEAKIRSARELDKIAQMKVKYNLELDDLTKKLLYNAYWWAFKACKINGIIQAKEENLNN